MGMATPFFAVFAKPTAGFRSISQVEAMHRIDEKLMKLDAHFEAANAEEKQSIQKEIKAWSNGGCCTELDGFEMDFASGSRMD